MTLDLTAIIRSDEWIQPETWEDAKSLTEKEKWPQVRRILDDENLLEKIEATRNSNELEACLKKVRRQIQKIAPNPADHDDSRIQRLFSDWFVAILNWDTERNKHQPLSFWYDRSASAPSISTHFLV